MASGMTEKQYKLLVFIREFIAEFGYSPSTEEMRVAMDVASKSRIAALLDALEERGMVLRWQNRARSVSLPRGSLAIFSTDQLTAEIEARKTRREYPFDRARHAS